METSNDMAYLMTAKICHDLAAPIGALGLGLESLPEDDIVKMLYGSYFISNFKLRFYRLFMTPHPKGPQIYDFVPLLNEYAKMQNINLIWTKNFLNVPELEPTISRAVMGFVYLVMEPLVRGGNCSVDLLEDGLWIEANGPLCPIRDTYKKIFQDETIEINGRSVYPYFLLNLLKEGGYAFHYEEHQNAIKIKIG
ncbi:MAG: hypothetical protein CNLJKLNK_00863 [Holosporales bacterium]